MLGSLFRFSRKMKNLAFFVFFAKKNEKAISLKPSFLGHFSSNNVVWGYFDEIYYILMYIIHILKKQSEVTYCLRNIVIANNYLENMRIILQMLYYGHKLNICSCYIFDLYPFTRYYDIQTTSVYSSHYYL